MSRPQWILLAATALYWAAPFAFAQTGSQGDRPAESSIEDFSAAKSSDAGRPQSGRQAERTLLLGDVVYLPGPDGKLVPVPADKTLAEYLEWRKNRTASDSIEMPTSSISSVTLDGDAEDDRAQLKVTIRVEIHEEGTWVRVPLQMHEAVLKETRHQGPGESSFGGLDRETGHRWWFRGKGQHVLTLSVIAPIRRQNSTRRLQMSLPAAAASELVLRVPFRAGSIKVTPESAWTKTTYSGTGSTIDVRGLGSRFDVSWQPQPAAEPSVTALQVQTSINLDLTGDTAVLEANQVIEALQGSFQELRVKLPAGFDLRAVEEPRGRTITSRTVAPPAKASPESLDKPSEIFIRLEEPTSGPLNLKWILEAGFPSAGRTFALEGFEVAGAIHQSGEILLSVADGYRVARREAEDQFVHRSQSKRSAPSGRPVTAWRFLKQPFRLLLDVREIDPYFTVEPRQQVHLSTNLLALDASFRFHVAADRGALQEVVLDWPGWKREGWYIQPVEARDIVQELQYDPDGGDGTFRVRLAGRKVGTFEIPFRASRQLTGDSASFEFSLPRVRAITPTSALVEIRCDENIEADIREIPNVVSSAPPNVVSSAPPNVVPSAPPNAVSSAPPNALAPAGGNGAEQRFARDWRFRIQPSVTKFTAHRITHTQAVSCLTTADIERRGPQLLVTQHLAFDVKFEPLAQARLRIPQEIEDRVLVSLTDGTALSRGAFGAETGSASVIRYSLPAAQTGKFELLARYWVDIPESILHGEPGEIRIPLVQPSETTVSSTEARLQQDEDLDLTVNSREWRMNSSQRGVVAWISTGNRADVNVSVRRNPSLPMQDFAIVRGWLKTEVDANGISRTNATYLVEGLPAPLVIRLPAGTTAGAVTWDGQRLSTDRVQDSRSGGREYRLSVPGSIAAGTHRLTVESQSMEGEALGLLQTMKLDCPEFPTASWVQHLAWEVVLPSNQHYFLGAAGFSPQYRWTWDRTHFSRKSAAPYDRLDRWIGDNAEGSGENDLSAANTYVFTRFGAARGLTLTTVSFPMLVLLGAGAAWMVGFLLLKLPAARNVMTLLSAALVIALLCLEFSTAVALLVQPAVIGLLLVATMIGIEHYLGRESTAAVLTISPVSESAPGLAPASSLTRAAASSHNDPVLRLPAGAERPSATASAGGVR